MTVLSAVQEAASALSVVKPATLFAANDDTTTTFLTLANQAGEDIARRADWSRMVFRATVTSGMLPSDFHRLVAGNAINVTSPASDPVRGPLSDEMISAIGRMGSTTRIYYALTGGQIVWSRALTTEIIEAVYVSRNWLVNGGTRRERIGADNDETMFPERLLVKGIMWRWRKEKGQQYQDHLGEFEADLAAETEANRGVTTR